MKNVYLGYVSLNNRDDLNLYQTDFGDIDARYTNEAGLKYAAEKLKRITESLIKQFLYAVRQ